MNKKEHSLHVKDEKCNEIFKLPRKWLTSHKLIIVNTMF